MHSLNEIIKQYKYIIKDILQDYEQELNNNKYENIYGDIEDIDVIPAFTALLLKNNINPLEYMDYVPAYFATNLDIKEIVIPDGIAWIQQSAFEDCGYLTSITIPKSVADIPSYAFDGCHDLKDVYYKGSKEDWENIEIDEDGNEELLNASIHYNS